MPDIRIEDIHVTLDRASLRIEGELPKPTVEGKQGKHILLEERHFGKFCRGIRLMEPVDERKVEATYKDGVLTVVLPKVDSEKSQVIPIQVRTK